MIDGIPTLVSSWGPTGLLALTVLMVLTGRLVPRRTYEDQRQATATWQAAYERQVDINVRMLQPTAELQRDVLRAIPQSAADDQVNGDPG